MKLTHKNYHSIPAFLHFDLLKILISKGNSDLRGKSPIILILRRRFYENAGMDPFIVTSNRELKNHPNDFWGGGGGGGVLGKLG